MDKQTRYWTFGLLAFAVVGGVILTMNRTRLYTSHAVQVAASFYPMAEFAREVGGKHVEVTTLVPAGTEPHDFDPSARDIADIYDSDLLVQNGAGLEPWITKIEKDIEKAGVFRADASTGIALLSQQNEDGSGTVKDPHIWLDPERAIAEVKNIKLGLIAVDPEHATDYVANAEAYIKKLEALDNAFRTGLANCKQKEIITSHQAFGYLADQYGFTAVGIAGLSPDDEPSPQKLAEIADTAKSRGIGYIFYENSASPKLSETVASETGAKTIAFNPLESLGAADQKAGKDYISVQEDNLEALQTAMGCTAP